MARRSNNSGFTLLELVLVLLILALCAAVAAPSLSGFTRGRRVPNTAQELVTTLRWCRVKAVSEGLTYHLNFGAGDNGAGRWWVTKDDGSGTNFVEPTDEQMKIDYTVPDGIVMTTNIKTSSSNNQTYISFDPGGRADVASIHFAAADGASADVLSDTPLSSYRIAATVSK